MLVSDAKEYRNGPPARYHLLRILLLLMDDVVMAASYSLSPLTPPNRWTRVVAGIPRQSFIYPVYPMGSKQPVIPATANGCVARILPTIDDVFPISRRSVYRIPLVGRSAG